MVKERSELYKSMLGDPKKQLAMQGYLQLAQFGLNLASAQGSNFAAKVANSAKDPLAAFAALGRQAQQDENSITLAAIKSSEDERSQSLKPGNFALLVNDIANSDPRLTPVEIVDKAYELSAAKTGQTDDDKRTAYFNQLFEAYTKYDMMPTDDATKAATKATNLKFGEKEKKDTEETTEETTDTAVIKIKDD